MEDGYTTEEPHIEKAAQAEFGAPKPAMDRPIGMWQIIRRPATAHLHDRDFIAFFRQSMGRNTAAESRSDNNEVKVEFVVALQRRFLVARFLVFFDRFIHYKQSPCSCGVEP